MKRFLMKGKNPKLLSVDKIWSHAQHNALTDLIRYKNRWFCVFREGEDHVAGSSGTIRLITSDDGIRWESLALMKEKYVDLRDPKLSITPKGQLMLLVGGTIHVRQKYISRQSRVAFSDDGVHWSSFQTILEPHEWLWKITWHKEKAYGVSYSYSNIHNKYDEWNVKLFESGNGIDYQLVTAWGIKQHPNETTLRFLDNDKMLALVRRDGPLDKKAWIGISDPPYKDWVWNSTHDYLGGPDFILLPDQRIFAAGRVLMISPYGLYAKTVLAEMNTKDFNPLIVLPSFGDCSYPGLAYYEGKLWMSYYSSHEDKTSIYLAKFIFE